MKTNKNKTAFNLGVFQFTSIITSFWLLMSPVAKAEGITEKMQLTLGLNPLMKSLSTTGSLGTGPEATHQLGINYNLSEKWQLGITYTDSVDSLVSEDGSVLTLHVADETRLRERQIGIKSTYFIGGIEKGTWFVSGQLQGGRTDLQYALQNLHNPSASLTWTVGAVIGHLSKSVIFTSELGYRNRFKGDTFSVQSDNGSHRISHSALSNFVGGLNLGINF